MRVLLVPNLRRPGVGRIPEPDGRRTSLPEHARLCPVVEDANRMGSLVLPPLEQREALRIRYRVENLYQFTLLRGPGWRAAAEGALRRKDSRRRQRRGAEVRDIRHVDRDSGLDEASHSARVGRGGGALVRRAARTVLDRAVSEERTTPYGALILHHYQDQQRAAAQKRGLNPWL